MVVAGALLAGYLALIVLQLRAAERRRTHAARVAETPDTDPRGKRP
jgi:hypothetical protein